MIEPVSLLVPNYARESFGKLLREFPNYPQELVRGERFIASRIRLYHVPTFYRFEVEFGFRGGVAAVLVRKIDVTTSQGTPQLEDKISLFAGEAHLGSTRAFKVINSANPFRLVESEIVAREDFRDYLASICHLAAYCAKSGGKGLPAELAQVVNHAASVAAVTHYCLGEKDPTLAVSCRDIIVNPLARRLFPPRQSVEIRYAGQP
ncbi:MAG: hypothetical protein HGA96_10240 [Desulfobulbaceae bacterium]|nr:hypothetical protein [Desulfobulbaceae bacterium]